MRFLASKMGSALSENNHLKGFLKASNRERENIYRDIPNDLFSIEERMYYRNQNDGLYSKEIPHTPKKIAGALTQKLKAFLTLRDKSSPPFVLRKKKEISPG